MGKEARLRLRPQTVFSAVLEGKKTFAELAPEYGFTTEAFEAEVLAKVGPKEFPRLKKESDRNAAEKEKKAMKKKTTKKSADTTTTPSTTTAVVNSDTRTTATTTTTPKEVKMKKERVVTRETLLRQRDNAIREIETAESSVAAEAALLEVEGDKVKAAEEKVASAKKILAEAQDGLKAAQKDFQKREKTAAEKLKNLQRWQDCLSNIVKNIQEMDAKLIYLVAPGYKGELPAVGQLISVVPFERATIEFGSDLYKEISAMDLLESGFDRISEAKAAYDFARLVIKYEIQDIEVTVLVDDDRIKRILTAQEVGF